MSYSLGSEVTRASADVLSLSSGDLESPHISEDNQITSAASHDSLEGGVCLRQDSSPLATSRSAADDVITIKPTDFSIGKLLKANGDNPHKHGHPMSIDTDDQLGTEEDNSRRQLFNCNFRSDAMPPRDSGDHMMKFYRAAALYYGCYVQLYHQHHLQQMQSLSPFETAGMDHDLTKEDSQEEIRTDVSPSSRSIDVHMRSHQSMSNFSASIDSALDSDKKIATAHFLTTSSSFQGQSQHSLDKIVDESRSNVISRSRRDAGMPHHCDPARFHFGCTQRDTFTGQQPDSCVQCGSRQHCSNRACVHKNRLTTGCIDTGADSESETDERPHRDGLTIGALRAAERVKCGQNRIEEPDVVMFESGIASETLGSYRKKTRTVFSSGQVGRLETMFDMKHYLSSTERSKLAAELRLTDTQVKIWFQNRRNKWKRQVIQNEIGTSDATGTNVVNLAAASERGTVPREHSKASGSTAAEHVLSFCSPFYYIGMVPPPPSVTGFQ